MPWTVGNLTKVSLVGNSHCPKIFLRGNEEGPVSGGRAVATSDANFTSLSNLFLDQH